MNIAVILRSIDTDSSVIDYIEQRIRLVFGRNRYAIKKATVTLSETGRQKGGTDKQCRIQIKPEGLSSIIVVEQRENLKAAIEKGLAKARHNLTKKLGRKRYSNVSENYRLLRAPLTLDGQLIAAKKT